MASKSAIYHMYACSTISVLRENGYIHGDRDWDVNGLKYTLRIQRQGIELNKYNCVGILLITYRSKDNTVVLINDNTGEKIEFQIDRSKEDNSHEFHDVICNFARQMQDEVNAVSTKG